MTAREKDERPGPHSRGVQPEVISILACEPRAIDCGTSEMLADELRGGDAA